MSEHPVPGRSLSLRLSVFALAWIALTLALAGVFLAGMFRDHVRRAFEAELADHAAQIVALAEFDDAGRVRLKGAPANPEFERPLSGWYWRLAGAGGGVVRSRSLWDQDLILPAAGDGAGSFVAGRGPRGEALVIGVRVLSLPEAPGPVVLAVAGPESHVADPLRRFVVALAGGLGLLGAGLALAVAVQVRAGLAPLRRMRAAVAEVRAGRREKVGGPFPADVQPLADEIDSLIEHNSAVIGRARTQAADLAHALKTPLAVIENEAAALGGEPGEALRSQAAVMGARVRRHLARARAAGARNVLGMATSAAPVVEDVVRALARLHPERDIATRLDAPDAVFAGEREDLLEMLGNLAENACAWARRAVRLTVRAAARDAPGGGARLIAIVEDDGPGIPEPARDAALARGGRLDESAPGSGLGLAIARDLAALYGGTLALGESDLGGLKAELDLPAASACYNDGLADRT